MMLLCFVMSPAGEDLFVLRDGIRLFLSGSDLIQQRLPKVLLNSDLNQAFT